MQCDLTQIETGNTRPQSGSRAETRVLVPVSRGFVHTCALLAIPDRRLDAPDLMSGTHITGHDAKLPVISDPGDLCTPVLSSPSQTAFKLQDSRS